MLRTNLLTATAFAVALSLPAMAEEPGADTVLARVGEVEITLGHAIALREQLPQQFRTVPDETLFPAIVEQLIEQELLHQHIGDDLTRRQRLALENELRTFTANAALSRAAGEALTEEAVVEAYEAFAAAFSEGEPELEYRAAHILVQTEEEIAQVVAALEEGREFGEVAREFSIDGSAQGGGDLGWFGQGVMIQPFEEAVVALEPGEVSDPVETQFGWHVVQLIDRRDVQVPPIEEVGEDLAEQIQREAARALLDELREQIEVERVAADIEPSMLSRRELLDD